MTLLDKLPEMDDAALETLGANAARLAASGPPKRMKEAQEVLPAIEAELATRKARKAAAAPPRKTPARKPAAKKTTKAAKASMTAAAETA